MKKLMIVPVVALLSFGALAASTETTTTKTFSSETSSPALDPYSSEYDEPLSPDSVDRTRELKQERMEERNENSSSIIESDDSVDYKDRTRTNRERHAINTGSHASDDK